MIRIREEDEEEDELSTRMKFGEVTEKTGKDNPKTWDREFLQNRWSNEIWLFELEENNLVRKISPLFHSKCT